ncbi:MAG TPA: hypothetical protein HPP64_09160 [Gammaproteobacteria bacterium]|jgi:hypothetical protein|nr:hypothetical protein [Gammaproteobacteria bacterium]HIJ23070.1 hypothetical protein [Gammaproteobacteria bacterium]
MEDKKMTDREIILEVHRLAESRTNEMNADQLWDLLNEIQGTIELDILV